MQKVRELRHKARECRVLAARAQSESARVHFAELARMWEKLADERLAFFVENRDSGPRSASTGSAAVEQD